MQAAATEPEVGIPEVDVAIVNWNTPEAAGEAARAFLASDGARTRVTVIDNNSRPEAQAKLETLMPEGARLIVSSTNLGFGAGANRALRDGSSEFVCVSNADVIPGPGAVAALASFCASRPDCGMVGAAFQDDSEYHAELPTPTALALRPLIGGFLHRSVPSPGPGRSIEVGQPAGACFLVRRKVWEEAGGFDEDYFLWYEDVDIARRLRGAGLRHFVCGEAVVHHNGGLATRKLSSADHQVARLAGLRFYLEKHHPRTLAISKPLFIVSRRLRARESQMKGVGFGAMRAKAIYIAKAAARRLAWAPSDLRLRFDRRDGRMVPPRGLSFVGRSDFTQTGQEFLGYFKEMGGLKPTARVLDVGCGIGRMAIPLTTYLSDGSYEGFDVGREMVRWCTRNITPRYPNFHFTWAPIYNRKYNPFGTILADELRFPYEANSFDFALATSLFTHLTRDDARHYLNELGRALRPEATSLLTFFLITPESEQEIVAGRAAFDFRYEIDGALTTDPRQPEEAVAFQLDDVLAMLDESGMTVVEPIRRGSWAHAPGAPSFQDIVIARTLDR
jgi:GT2 family glycosyltransferase